jgi:hypothetical protein
MAEAQTFPGSGGWGDSPGGGGTGGPGYGGPDSSPPPVPGAPPPSGGGGGGGGYGGGGYTPGSWDRTLSWDVPYLAAFNAPKFKAPDAQSLFNDPGYAARLGAGRDALEKSAAAKGVLRTGGTLRDLVSYNQNFAAQEYGNAFQRALAEYGANYNAAKDAYAPTMAMWKEQAMASRLAAMESYNAAYNAWSLGEHNKRQAASETNADRNNPPA